MSTKLTTALFIEKANVIHENKYDYSKTEYVNSRTKVFIVCSKHGEFSQRASSHLLGNGCPQCAKEWSEEHKEHHKMSARKSRGLTQEEWLRRAREIHGDKYDYSLVEYINQRTDVKIICPKHGVFEQKADSHIRGVGCRFCGYEVASEKADHTWSDEQREKIANTCMERYGAPCYLDSDEGKQKMDKIRNDSSFKEKMKSIISSEAVQEKTRLTNRLKYGVDSPMQLKEVIQKVYKTKKQNHTVNSSKVEETAYEQFSNYFGKENVIHHHKDDDVYPFICDFYIRPLNLFVEFNLHWSHGYHFFGSIESDYDTLSIWKDKAETSKYYKSALHVWAVRDIEKRNTALKNNLNYLVFWKNDLSDFLEWLNNYKNGIVILKNI